MAKDFGKSYFNLTNEQLIKLRMLYYKNVNTIFLRDIF